jgi:hypothetical protein
MAGKVLWGLFYLVLFGAAANSLRQSLIGLNSDAGETRRPSLLALRVITSIVFLIGAIAGMVKTAIG